MENQKLLPAPKSVFARFHYGIDFGLFLGSFLSYIPTANTLLDTEVREEDLKGNLIVIGGPITNKIMEQMIQHSPLTFDRANNMNIISKI